MPVCNLYDASACCSTSYTTNFSESPTNIYPGWTYNQCPAQKPLISAKCNRFLQYQECSFGCDSNPRVSDNYPASSTATDKRFSIHLCASYCDEWFSSCADDYTCFKTWVPWPGAAGQDPMNVNYSCSTPEAIAAGASCRTYRDVYGSGRELSETMVSNTYSYSNDSDTCVSLGPSLTGACFPGLPNPAPAKPGCVASQAQPATTRADGSSSCPAAPAAAAVNVGLIVGPVIAGVAVLGFAAAAVAWRCRGRLSFGAK
jgi:hypothetical protein